MADAFTLPFIKLLDPYSENSGAVMFTSADVDYTDGVNPAAKSNLHYDRKSYKMTDSMLNQQLLEIRDKYLPQDVQGDVNSKRCVLS